MIICLLFFVHSSSVFGDGCSDFHGALRTGGGPSSLATPFDLLYGTFEHVSSPEASSACTRDRPGSSQVIVVLPDQPGVSILIHCSGCRSSDDSIAFNRLLTVLRSYWHALQSRPAEVHAAHLPTRTIETHTGSVPNPLMAVADHQFNALNPLSLRLSKNNSQNSSPSLSASLVPRTSIVPVLIHSDGYEQRPLSHTRALVRYAASTYT